MDQGWGCGDLSPTGTATTLGHQGSWWWRGLGIALPLGALAWLSPRFAYEVPLVQQPILLLVALLLGAGACYLWALRGLPRRGLAWLLLLGLAMRLAMLGSTPMLEDDFYRYLWDGAVSAQGLNPYRYAPGQVQRQEAGVPGQMRRLAAQAPRVLARVNHPYLRSIYPPLSQAAFALAHWLRPWSLSAWRLLLLAADLATLLLLYLLLKRLGLPLAGLAIYWWNPLLVREVYNAGHLEVLIFPFLLGAILLALAGRLLWAAGVLGLAVGVKIWPVLLLPVLLRPWLRRPLRLAGALLLFAGVSGALLLPLLRSGLDQASGLAAYVGYWQMNDSAFLLLHWAVQELLQITGPGGEHAQALARGLVAGALAAWCLLLARRAADGPAETVRRCLLVVAALFLLSPTQFPWYYLWLLPLLALRPLAPLLWLSALLPLYYLRFWCSARGLSDLYDYGLVWLIYLPVWAGLLWQWRWGRVAAA